MLLRIAAVLMLIVSPDAECTVVPGWRGHSSTARVPAVLRLRGGQGAPVAEPRDFSGSDAASAAAELEAFDTVLKRRFFFGPAFSIHGGVSGLFDYGPTGCAVKRGLVAAWREHFVIEEGMLEIDCPAVTPAPVLAASGHVKRFSDLMVRDEQSGECFRADKLLEDACAAALARLSNAGMRTKELQHAAATADMAMEYVEGMAPELAALVKAAGSEAERRAALGQLSAAAALLSNSDLDSALRLMDVSSPSTNAPLSASFPFNLMFQTSIGPSGAVGGFLRPETAQGIFTNFKRLLDFNGGRLPMAVAQIGKAFRNEIAPKQGLLRQREFEMAEVEHFLPFNDSSHTGFAAVAHLPLLLWPANDQEAGAPAVSRTIGDALTEGILSNQALGYYLGKTAVFLGEVCRLSAPILRFRQHRRSEMAHYAADCWDAEVYTRAHGWVECVGHADRASYDLEMHAKATGIPLVAWAEYSKPQVTHRIEAQLDNAAVGKAFRAQAKEVKEALLALAHDQPERALAAQQSGEIVVRACGTDVVVACGQGGMVQFQEVESVVHGANFVPRVIEPSFGIDRLVYCALEHAFYVRPAAAEEGGEKGGGLQRTVLRLSPALAPYKCCVTGLSGNVVLQQPVTLLHRALRRRGVRCLVDESGAFISFARVRSCLCSPLAPLRARGLWQTLCRYCAPRRFWQHRHGVSHEDTSARCALGDDCVAY